MRGCALSLTTNIINSIPFLHIHASQPSFSFPSQSLTIHNPTLKPLPSTSLSIHYHHPVHAQQHQSQLHHDNDEEEEESFQILTSVKTDYNDIMIVDTPNSRMLLLDSSHNVHSILYKERKWTNSYWDEFASLPAIVPEGPIAILGLGGGTAAHLMLELWPSLRLEGWEIDDILIDKARDYFGLSDLEKTTEDGGILSVHIGDVFVPSEDLHGRYAGIVVDLFSDGKVLPQLQEVSTWLELRDRLMANGRLMVNCGGIDASSSVAFASSDPGNLSNDEAWLLNAAMKALSKAFPGELSWKRMPKETGENFMALTGALPDLKSWSANVPSPLSTGVVDWRPCGMVSRI
ncbi:uncharacterized protein LOC127135064 isoform X1 [Lathyrus oleraceus]|uniref:S-adenosyl-L-methionine-dependent methyltransferases superfamily protein n=1 Tax=Pisum sativum TaxID=3888 RepID=A0A9D5BL13_PEA|nr:uncharacterized protein LOC127135064 isoform X1 [Pisum sativum]KAI5445476.1 hypothetical protein KIW84_013636 [Pisum sativum]